MKRTKADYRTVLGRGAILRLSQNRNQSINSMCALARTRAKLRYSPVQFKLKCNIEARKMFGVCACGLRTAHDRCRHCIAWAYV